jgi:CRP-like cAMP-binding protein
MTNRLIAFLQQHRFFSAHEQQLIKDSFEPRFYKEGGQLFKGGNICRDLFFVCNGVLRIMVTNQNGVELTHFFLKEDMFCTILHSFNNEVPATESIQAACDVDVLAISKSKLLALYKQVPGLKELLDQIMQNRLLDKIQIRSAFLGADSETRYKLFMQQQPDIVLRVPLKDIASYLGITPQSLSRIRKSIK